MAGRLQVEIAGQKADIAFENSRMIVRVDSYRAARKIQRYGIFAPKLLSRALSAAKVDMYAQVGSGKPFTLYPNPGLIVRLLSPRIRQLARS